MFPRRTKTLAAAVLVSTVGIVGCGSGNSGDDTDSAAPDAIRVEHAYGETVLDKAPERVITLGLSDQDPVLALGVKPVAVAPWYGDYPDHIWPWARTAIGDAKPVVLNDGVRNDDEPPYEELAELKPDLIVSLYNGTTEEQYDRLTDIAPTLVPTKDSLNFSITWQEALRLTGQALDRTDQADQVTTELEGKFDTVASENPQFAGKTAVIAERFEESNTQTIVRSGSETRAQFFRRLGFTIPDEIAGAKADDTGEITVSDENMAALSKDLLVWNVGWDDQIKPQLEAMDNYQNLPVVKNGKVLWIEDPVVSGAFSFGTALSLSYALDELTPQLQEVLPPPN